MECKNGKNTGGLVSKSASGGETANVQEAGEDDCNRGKMGERLAPCLKTISYGVLYPAETGGSTLFQMPRRHVSRDHHPIMSLYDLLKGIFNGTGTLVGGLGIFCTHEIFALVCIRHCLYF